VRIRALSQVPEEAEVLVPPPSVYRIVAVAMFHGSLVVTLERVDSPLAYLLQPAPVLPVTHAKTSSAAGGGAAASSDDVEEELQALVSEMTQLQLGMKKACVTFARSLADEGVMSLQRLRGMQAQDARDILQSAGMKKLQVDAVMQAFCAQAQEQAAAAQKKAAEAAAAKAAQEQAAAAQKKAAEAAAKQAQQQAAGLDLGPFAAADKHVRYGAHVYASLHCRTVTGGTYDNYAQDGCTPVAIPAGYHVAPPDAEALHVCGAYPWQSYCLVFSDGRAAGTSISHPSYTGRKFGWTGLLVTQGGLTSVGEGFKSDDVLLRKREG